MVLPVETPYAARAPWREPDARWGKEADEHMKRISLFATLAVTAAITMGAFASVSTAAPAGGRGASAAARLAAGSRTPYVFNENVSEYYGNVTCKGIHIVNKKYPEGKDIETCKAVSGKLLHMVAGAGQKEFESASGGHVSEWLSDYNRESKTTNYSYSVNKKLTRFRIIAIY